MAHDLDAIARTLRDAIGLAPDDWNPTEHSAHARLLAAVAESPLVAAVRWAQGAPHHYGCAKFGGLMKPCTCGRDEALGPFGGDRAIRHVAGRGFVWPSAGLALCDEVDRLRVQNERLTLLATDRGEQLKKCAGKLAEQRTLISEVALEREQALAEAHRLRGEWEDAIANNEGVWEEGFHKGREYQREAERRG
jgi:hypothetical protein